MNNLPQMGNSSDLDKGSIQTYDCVKPFSDLSLESTEGSMTHFSATTSFFSQQILLILILLNACSPIRCAGIQMLLSSGVCVSAKCW